MIIFPILVGAALALSIIGAALFVVGFASSHDIVLDIAALLLLGFPVAAIFAVAWLFAWIAWVIA